MTAIVAGVGHSSAVAASGGAKCWGSNYEGQLGDGTTTMRLTPVDVIGLSSGVVAIAAAEIQSCALTSAGEVKCWGNGTGHVGGTPVQVGGLYPAVSVITTGQFHSCAVVTGGARKCWVAISPASWVTARPPTEQSPWE